MRKSLKVIVATVLGAGFLAAGPASAQFAKPDDAIKYRKATMFVQQQHFARIGAMVQGKVPFDQNAAAANAAIVADLSKLHWQAFGPNTEKGDTRALPEIWMDNARFMKSARDLEDATAKLAAAAKSGGVDAIKGPFGAVGKLCQSCHDDFRKQ